MEYSEIQQELWTWIAPLLVPNFSLMLSVSASEALVNNNNGNSSKVRRKYYQLSYRLSTAYLILILLSMFLEMFFSADYNPLGVLKVSGLWIAIFQGFVTSAIGVLFFTKKEGNN
ncbi:MAG: hypothetical protein QNJ55_14700 [Xenococcus sp. MO_188.B8]|nr:hypothetical protein [Xenococcus sp. MO_188.B8]